MMAPTGDASVLTLRDELKCVTPARVVRWWREKINFVSPDLCRGSGLTFLDLPEVFLSKNEKNI